MTSPSDLERLQAVERATRKLLGAGGLLLLLPETEEALRELDALGVKEDITARAAASPVIDNKGRQLEALGRGACPRCKVRHGWTHERAYGCPKRDAPYDTVEGLATRLRTALTEAFVTHVRLRKARALAAAMRHQVFCWMAMNHGEPCSCGLSPLYEALGG